MTGTTCLTGDELRKSLTEQLPDGGAWVFVDVYEQSDGPRTLCAKDTAEYHAEQLAIVHAGQEKEAIGTELESRGTEVYAWRTEEQRTYHALKAGEIIGPDDVPVSVNQFYDEAPKYVDEYGPYEPGEYGQGLRRPR